MRTKLSVLTKAETVLNKHAPLSVGVNLKANSFTATGSSLPFAVCARTK
jgi:hypothetical protein